MSMMNCWGNNLVERERVTVQETQGADCSGIPRGQCSCLPQREEILLLTAFRIAIHAGKKKQTNFLLVSLLLLKFLQILHPSLPALGWPAPTALSLVSRDDSIRFLKREEEMGSKAQVKGLPLARRGRSPLQPEGRR